jgi:YD repeat-containing protein
VYEASLFGTVQIANGDAISFAWKGDHWEPGEPFGFGGTYPIPWSLQETADYFYLLDPVGERVHIFYKFSTYGNYVGRLARIVDRNGNQLIYSYAGADELYPSRVEDGLGRSLDFTYQDVGGHTALVRVADQAGRQVNLTHEAQGADNGNAWTLRSVSDPMGQITTFLHTWLQLDPWHKWYGQIVRVERPAGNSPYTQAYALETLSGTVSSRVISQTDAYSRTTAFTYDAGALKVTENRPDGATQIYEHYGPYSPPQALTDPTGKTMQFGWDENNNRLTSTTDRLGDTTQVTYHVETGKIASYTDAEGKTTTFTYTAQTQTFTISDFGFSVRNSAIPQSAIRNPQSPSLSTTAPAWTIPTAATRPSPTTPTATRSPAPTGWGRCGITPTTSVVSSSPSPTPRAG